MLWGALAVALVIGLTAVPARAQEDPLEALSDEDFNRVVELLEEAREAEAADEWRIALAFFEEVSAIVELPEVRIREARAHEALGDTEDAVVVYERLAGLDSEIGDEAREALVRLRTHDAEPATARSGRRFILPVTLTTLAVGSLATGAVLGANANTIGDDYLAARELALASASDTAPNLGALEQLNARRDEAFARARQANAMYGVGAALAVGGAVAWGLAARRGASGADEAADGTARRASVRWLPGWSSQGIAIDW
jgi:tetratricopeptide (TPR) repeat protein